MNQELKNKIEATDWWQADGPCAIQLVKVPMVGFLEMPKYFPGIEFWGVIAVIKDEYGYQFMDQKNNLGFVRYIVEHWSKDKSYFDQKLKIWQGWQSKLYSFREKFDRLTLSLLSNQDLFKIYHELCLDIVEAWAIPLVLEGNGMYFEQMVVPELAKKYNLRPDIISDKLSAMVISEKPSVAKSEHLEILELARSFIQKNIRSNINFAELQEEFPEVAKKVSLHQQRYFWMLNNYQDNVVLDEEHFLKEIREVLSQKNLSVIKSEIDGLSDTALINKKRAIVEELKLDQDTQDLLKLFATFSWVMDERKKDMLIGTHYLCETLKEIARRLNWDHKTSYCLLDEEIKDYLLNGRTPDEVRIRSRKKLAVMIFSAEKHTEKIFFGPEAEEIDVLVFDVMKRNTAGQSLRGMVACKGNCMKLTGEVSIIRNTRTDDFKEGAILVASMTRPEFVPLMKKAKAIITDEGGITSHAAIVSRELNIPCIIGTKTATTILKSGDLVELDIANGKINIINNQ